MHDTLKMALDLHDARGNKILDSTRITKLKCLH
jgi:hypothetical protein